MRVLFPSLATVKTLICLGKRPAEGLAESVTRGEHPRIEYLELQKRTGGEVIDYRSVDTSTSAAVHAMRTRFGDRWGLALMAYWRKGGYDNLYATGEDVGLPLALMLRARRWYGHLTMVVHGAHTPKRRALFRFIGHKTFKQLIVLASEQRRIVTEEIGFPREKVHFLHNWVDQHFYRAERPVLGDYALSVGMENRDYPTLFEAAKGLPYKFHVVGSGFSQGPGYSPASGLRVQEHFTMGSGYSFPKLKQLYANARFVVVPIKLVPYAAGVTAILEGMCMGKAIVASSTPGIRDYVKDGVSARLVPPGDVGALRNAFIELWDDTRRLEEMGRHNRCWMETDINTDRYVDQAARLLGHR